MTIEIVDEILIQQIEQIAVLEKRTPEQIVADAIRLYTTQTQKIPGVSFLLSIAGQGSSTETDVSTRDEQILATEIDPIRGWAVKRDHDETAT